MRTPSGATNSAFARSSAVPHVMTEHDVVRLRGSLHASGRIYPKGTLGTIVGVWKTGELYEVEFAEPRPAVETVPASALAPIGNDV